MAFYLSDPSHTTLLLRVTPGKQKVVASVLGCGDRQDRHLTWWYDQGRSELRVHSREPGKPDVHGYAGLWRMNNGVTQLGVVTSDGTYWTTPFDAKGEPNQLATRGRSGASLPGWEVRLTPMGTTDVLLGNLGCFAFNVPSSWSTSIDRLFIDPNNRTTASGW